MLELPRPALRGTDFHELMRYRIMDILLVATPYDSFLLEEAGELQERVLGEFRNLDLHYGPGLTSVSSGAEALSLARERPFGLIITAIRLGDMEGPDLARRVRDAGLDIPVVLLAFDNRELKEFLSRNETNPFERIFLWQGDARILLAIVKSIEDWHNVADDAGAKGVQVILLVEDNVRYYSSFLPTIYAELLSHSQRLISEGVNLSEKILRMRARPKILLCETYEEAWEAFTAYREDLLGIVSDIEFPKGGQRLENAGLDLAHRVREELPDVPILLQSSRPENATLARHAGFDFLLKGSPLLLQELRRFMTENFGFGDFVFRRPGGAELARASDLRGLEETLATVPTESIAYHGARNHFSKWLKARTEFALAQRLRPRKIADFQSLEDLRKSLIHDIAEYRREKSQRVVVDFNRDAFEATNDFYRIGGGSLGGKARGLVFIRRLVAGVGRGLGGATIDVPPAVVLGTDVFEQFLDSNALRDFAIDCTDDAEIEERFQAAEFPGEVSVELGAFLSRAGFPLAVRSSSLLEDSRYQPFSGVYETFVLPNNHPFLDSRLTQLLRAIKRVYASTFSRRAKGYIAATPYRLEEEKMAVIIQRIVGTAHGRRFYPDFAGVARSYNFYPTPPLAATDGIAAVALGLGRTVVEGGLCTRFCPRDPSRVIPPSSAAETLEHAQQRFWALDLAGGDEMRETEFDLKTADEDGTLAPVASTYSPDDERIHEGVGRLGIRFVNFAPILRHGVFPLAEILKRLLDIGAWGMGAPVEIEFAGNLKRREFGLLQLRPLAISREGEELEIRSVEDRELVCRSREVLGNGRIDDIQDVVVVDQQKFDRARSGETAIELSRFNAELLGSGRPYLLIGVGRWGSKDPWLGIPVAWDQISGARAIVEAGFRDFRVAPSQGTHFFQNLTSFNVGYFTVNPDVGGAFVDWEWLAAQPAVREASSVRHVRFPSPVIVQMDGRRGHGVIYKPNSSAS